MTTSDSIVADILSAAENMKSNNIPTDRGYYKIKLTHQQAAMLDLHVYEVATNGIHPIMSGHVAWGEKVLVILQGYILVVTDEPYKGRK